MARACIQPNSSNDVNEKGLTVFFPSENLFRFLFLILGAFSSFLSFSGAQCNVQVSVFYRLKLSHTLCCTFLCSLAYSTSTVFFTLSIRNDGALFPFIFANLFPVYLIPFHSILNANMIITWPYIYPIDVCIVLC